MESPRSGVYLPVMIAGHISGSRRRTRIGDLIDRTSGCVLNPIDDPFGDSCWRSSWTYASLLVLYGEDRSKYDAISYQERITIDDARRFITFFAENCASDNGFDVWGSNQKYSRDQLLPLMYFLACIKRYDDSGAHAQAANSIVHNLREHESHGRSLSADRKGEIGRNLGYLIRRLCKQYGIVYRWKTRPAWLAAATIIAGLNVAWNIAHAVQIAAGLADARETDASRIASDKNASFLKQAFAAALSFNAQTASFEGNGAGVSLDIGDESFSVTLDDLVDGYSVFNALAALSQLRVASGRITGPLASWRGKFRNMADLGWGPAFEIVVGDSDVIVADDAQSWRTSSADDNDIIQSQRPKKFMGDDPLFPSKASSGFITLDGLVLSAFARIW